MALPTDWNRPGGGSRSCGSLLVLLGLLLFAGCAAPAPTGVQVLSTRLAPTTRGSSVDTAPVGIISTSSLPLLRVQWPLSRRETLRRSSDQTEEILYHAAFFWPAAFATVPYLSAQAASARLAGLSETEFKRARETYQATLPLLLVHDGLRRAVADVARARGWANWALVPKPYPPGDPAQFERMAYFLAATLAWLPKGTNALEYLRAQPTDTVLELEVNNAALAGKLGADRPLALSFDLEVRCWRIAEANEPSRLRLRYEGRKRRFVQWMAQGGEPFLHELQNAQVACARVIVDWCAGIGRDQLP